MRFWIVGNMAAGILGTIVIIAAQADPGAVQKAVFGWFVFQAVAVIIPAYAFCSPLPSGMYPNARNRAAEAILLIVHLLLLVILFAVTALYVRRVIGG